MEGGVRQILTGAKNEGRIEWNNGGGNVKEGVMVQGIVMKSEG